MENMFYWMFIIIMLFSFCFVIFGIICILSPKLQAKMMKKNLKTLNYMMKDSAKEINDLTNNSKDLLNENKDNLKDIADINASINEDAIAKTAEAIARGIKKGK